MKSKDSDTVGFIAAKPMHMGGWKINNKAIATISAIENLNENTSVSFGY